MMQSKSFWIILVLLFLSVSWPFLFGFGLGASLISLAESAEVTDVAYEYVRGDESSENKILLIEISGPILDKSPEYLAPFGSLITFGYDIKEELILAAEDDSIKAVMFEITSPGGTVTGSRAIADGISYYQEATGRPVYGFGSGIVASGAYWVIAGTDQIWIDRGSLVGSIGVIGGQFPVYQDVTALGNGILGPDVTTEGGIDMVTITSGEGKDMGNPFRQPTDKELSILQSSADQAYQGFVNYVAVQRELDPEFIVTQIGAYIYGEEQAQEFGLVDQLGNREQAYGALASQLEVEGDYQIVRSNDPSDWFSSLLGVATRIRQPQSQTQATHCTLTHKVLAYHGVVADLCSQVQ